MALSANFWSCIQNIMISFGKNYRSPKAFDHSVTSVIATLLHDKIRTDVAYWSENGKSIIIPKEYSLEEYLLIYGLGEKPCVEHLYRELMALGFQLSFSVKNNEKGNFKQREFAHLELSTRSTLQDWERLWKARYESITKSQKKIPKKIAINPEQIMRHSFGSSGLSLKLSKNSQISFLDAEIQRTLERRQVFSSLFSDKPKRIQPNTDTAKAEKRHKRISMEICEPEPPPSRINKSSTQNIDSFPIFKIIKQDPPLMNEKIKDTKQPEILTSVRKEQIQQKPIRIPHRFKQRIVNRITENALGLRESAEKLQQIIPEQDQYMKSIIENTGEILSSCLVPFPQLATYCIQDEKRDEGGWMEMQQEITKKPRKSNPLQLLRELEKVQNDG